jgi:hypothetical protein
VINLPKQVAYKTFGFLKQWVKMAKKDGANMESWLVKVKEGLKRW